MNQEKESPYEIGVRVTCADGDCGVLHRVIMDPTTKALTHLVVGPDPHSARLVPVTMVGSASTGAVVLICSGQDLDRLEPAEATEVIQGGTDLGARGSTLGTYSSSRPRTETVTYDRVPAGEVQIRRGEKVHAADGDIGRLQGLVVDRNHHVTYVLMSQGHWWSRKKEVAIPIGHVTDAVFGVQLDLTRGEVRELPEVDLARLG